MKRIILFDGSCVMCNAWVQFVIKRDRKDIFSFAALQSPYAQGKLLKAGLSQEAMDSVVFIQEELLLLKSRAVIAILKTLGGVWGMIGWLLSLVPNSIRDKIYDWIAKYRYKLFGKRENCMLPLEAWRNRMIEI